VLGLGGVLFLAKNTSDTLITNAFVRCGMLNAVDGTEDHLIKVQSVPEYTIGVSDSESSSSSEESSDDSFDENESDSESENDESDD